MKKQLLLAVLLVVSINLFAQISFQSHLITENSNNTILGVKHSITGDINNDGNNDIVVSTDSGEVLAILNNGNRQFSNPVSLLKTYRVANIALADIENDGDLDLCVVSVNREHNLSSIVFYRNNGLGNFSFAYSLEHFNGVEDPALPEYFTHPVYNVKTPLIFLDLDNDGDLDLISNMRNTYVNNGIGPQGSSYSGYNFNNLIQGDINNDGKIDLLFTDYLSWRENNGNNYYSHWTYHEINFYQNASIYDAKLVDMDNDNDLDIIISYRNGNDQKIIWKENDGSGSFITEHIIENNTLAEQIWISDVNADSTPDLIIKTNNTLKYYLNSSQGNTFTEHDICSLLSHVISIDDINNDGNDDIFFFVPSSQSSFVLYNNTNGFDTPQQITQSGYYASDIAVADLNNNNHKELVFASKSINKISSFTHLTNNPQEHIINNTLSSKKMVVADFDNDNDNDIISMNISTATLLNNNNNTYTATQFVSGFFGNEAYSFVKAVDLNNDNNIDVLSSYYFMVDGLLNDGTGSFQEFSYTPIPICDAGDRDFIKPIVFDANNNGSNEVAFYDNWSNLLTIASINGAYEYLNLSVPNNAFIYDIDKMDWNNDGLVDIVMATQDGLYVLENTGNYQFANFHLISTDKFYKIKTIDIDNDSDLDIIVAGEQIPKLRLLENNGSGFFGNIHVLGNDENEVSKILTTDYDGDNDIDIFVAYDYKGKVIFFENDLYSDIEQLDVSKISIYPNPADNFINIQTKDDIDLKKIIIKNISGQELMSFDISSKKQKIDVSKLSKALYFIDCIDKNGKKAVIKWIKK